MYLGMCITVCSESTYSVTPRPSTAKPVLFVIDMNAMNIESTDLNLLKVFEALHEEGGASRASLRLGITQSAVSAALARLRLVYSDPLFTRTGRGLAPTERANGLKPVVSDALNKIRLSLALGSGQAHTFEGRTLSIGMSDDFEIALGHRLIEAASQRAPGLRLVFRQTHSRIVSDMLMRREIALAVTAGGATSRTLHRESFGEGRYCCVMDAGAPDLANPTMMMDDFLRHQHVLVSSGGYVGVVDEVLASLGLQREILASTTHFSALPHLLRRTTAIATLPWHAAMALGEVSGMRVLACPLDMPRYPIELSWHKGSLRDPSADEIRAVAAQLLSDANWR